MTDTKMKPARREKGSGTFVTIDGKRYIRIRHKEGGKVVNKHYCVDSLTITDSKKLLQDKLGEFRQQGIHTFKGEQTSFRDYAAWFSEQYAIPPVYRDKRKVAGQRNWKGSRQLIAVLTEYFGDYKLRNIRYADLEKFRLARLDTPTKQGKPRTVTTVNRELMQLRTMLNVSVRENLIPTNPFHKGRPLITVADEVKRERILTRAEEELLLAACTDKRSHLKPILLIALDCGLRRGEILSLLWADVRLRERTLTIRAENSKTMRTRTVGLTGRVLEILTQLRGEKPSMPSARIFPYNDIKNAFESVRKMANLGDLRFHDLRHSAITKMLLAGMPAQLVMKVSGHSQISTFLRYSNADGEIATKIASALDSYLEATSPRKEVALPSEKLPSETSVVAFKGRKTSK